LGAAWWVRRRPFRMAVEGHSMEPTLSPGDYLVAVRRTVRLGDLVVVDHPERPGFELVKRVTGVGEDPSIAPEHYFVEGDRAEATTDSRTFGPVPADGVLGVVVMRYWPPGRVRVFR
jgi:nickel-type superoxide dismutase maturation protease